MRFERNLGNGFGVYLYEERSVYLCEDFERQLISLALLHTGRSERLLHLSISPPLARIKSPDVSVFLREPPDFK